MERRIMKPLSWIMIFMLLFQWSGVSAAVAAQREAEARQEQIDQAVEKLERLFDALEEAAKEIPRDTFDPQAIVDKVGKDPVALFEWVRDNTYLVPYRGTLRGPIGVLMDRLGNSLDRALLLYELLTLAGHRAHLVQGSLSDEQAEMVLTEARPIPPRGAFPQENESGDSTDDLIAKYAAKHGLDPAELHSVIRKITMDHQHMAEEVAQRVKEQTKAILDLVGEPEVDVKAAARGKAINALTNHWWVQWEGSSGRIDLDSTLPGKIAGQTLVPGGPPQQPDDIGEDLQHLVTIRILIERWEDGELKDPQEVLKHTLHPSKLFGKGIVLRHIPRNLRLDFDPLSMGQSHERLKNAVLQETEWLPVLIVGSEKFVQYGFTNEGYVNYTPIKQAVSKIGEGIRKKFRLFESAVEERQKKSYLIAEWIEYEIQVPEGAPQRIRRQIFDLLGASKRHKTASESVYVNEPMQIDRGLILLGDTEILLPICRLSNWFVLALRAEHLINKRAILMAIVRGQVLKTQDDITPRPGNVYDLALSRWQLSPFGTETFIDRPTILTYHRQLRNEQKTIARLFAFDIVTNQSAVNLTSEINPFLVHMQQGITDANTEGVLIEQLDVGVNTAEVFYVANIQGIRWVNIDSNNKHQLNDLNLNADTISLMEEDLSNGFVVLVPEKPALIANRQVVGWWRLDPIGGYILGIDERGWGAATLTEYQLSLWLSYGCLAGGSLVTVGEVIFFPMDVTWWDGAWYVLCLLASPATGILKGKITREVTNAVLKAAVFIMGALAGAGFARM